MRYEDMTEEETDAVWECGPCLEGKCHRCTGRPPCTCPHTHQEAQEAQERAGWMGVLEAGEQRHTDSPADYAFGGDLFNCPNPQRLAVLYGEAMGWTDIKPQPHLTTGNGDQCLLHGHRR